MRRALNVGVDYYASRGPEAVTNSAGAGEDTELVVAAIHCRFPPHRLRSWGRRHE